MLDVTTHILLKILLAHLNFLIIFANPSKFIIHVFQNFFEIFKNNIVRHFYFATLLQMGMNMKTFKLVNTLKQPFKSKLVNKKLPILFQF